MVIRPIPSLNTSETRNSEPFDHSTIRAAYHDRSRQSMTDEEPLTVFALAFTPLHFVYIYISAISAVYVYLGLAL